MDGYPKKREQCVKHMKPIGVPMQNVNDVVEKRESALGVDVCERMR